MANEKLTEAGKWMISLWSSILFFLVASSFMFNLVRKNLCYKCPDWTVVLILSIIFAICTRLLMFMPLPKTFEEYNGLANPAGMINFNLAQLRAEDVGCTECTKAATTCLRNPFSADCHDMVEECESTCDNVGVVDAIRDGQRMVPNVNYFVDGVC